MPGTGRKKSNGNERIERWGLRLNQGIWSATINAYNQYFFGFLTEDGRETPPGSYKK